MTKEERRKVLGCPSWEELLRMHDFYMKGPKTNVQCQQLLHIIEQELSERACESADMLLEKLKREK